MTSPGHEQSSLASAAAVRVASADLLQAVVAMDSSATRRMLRRARAAEGAVHLWDHLARPVLQLLAQQFAPSGSGLEDEHLFYQALMAVLAATPDAGPPPRSLRPVLLACMPGELHSLPVLALSAGLAECGVDNRNFGAALPAAALADAIRCIAPAAVFLWAHTSGYADVDLLSTLPGTPLLLGGPGWADQDLPPASTHSTSLTDAIDHITNLTRCRSSVICAPQGGIG